MADANESSNGPPPKLTKKNSKVELTRDEFNRGTEMFDDMDRNHDGVVDIIEFQSVMEQVAARSGRVYTFEAVRRMFLDADRNGDGVIDYDEWMSLQRRQKARRLGAGRGAASNRRSRCSRMSEDESTPQMRRTYEEPFPSSTTPAVPAAPMPAAAAADPSPPPPAAAAAASSSSSYRFSLPATTDALRELLSSLRGAPDKALASEAERLLSVSLLDKDDDEESHERGGALPSAGEREHAAELAKVVLRATDGGVRSSSCRSSAGNGAAVDPMHAGGGAGGGGAGGGGAGGTTPEKDEEEDEAQDGHEDDEDEYYDSEVDGPFVPGLEDVEEGGEEGEDDEDEDEDEEGGGGGAQKKKKKAKKENVARGLEAGDTGGNAATGASALSKGSVMSGVNMTSMSAPFEIWFTQVQFTGLTAGILAAMERRWEDLGIPRLSFPPLANHFSGLLSWTEALNIDLNGLNKLLSLPCNFVFSEAARAQCSVSGFASVIRVAPHATVFMWVALIVPLVLSLVMILSQKPLLSTVWIGVLMGGCMLIIASVAGSYVSVDRLVLLNLTLLPYFFQAFAIAGITMVAAFLLRGAVVSYWTLRTELMKAKFKMRLAAERAKRKDIKTLQESLLTHLKDKNAARSPLVICRSVTLCLLFLILSQVRALNALAIGTDARKYLQSTYWNVLFTEEVAVLCWIGFFAFFLRSCLLLFKLGRWLISEVMHVFNQVLLAFVLLLLSFLYMPITRQLLTVFICKPLDCKVGEWYPKQAHSWDSAFVADATFQERVRGTCEPCRFYNYATPGSGGGGGGGGGGVAGLLGDPTFNTSCPAFPTACSGEVLHVLREDNTMKCDASWGFYVAASVIMLLGFTAVVPYLFYTIVAEHTRILKNIKIDEERLEAIAGTQRISVWKKVLCCVFYSGMTKKTVAWDYRILKTRNRAKALYEHFEYRHRFFRLVILLQKLCLVLVSLFIAEAEGEHTVEAGCIISIILHGSFLYLIITQRPYFNPLSDALSAGASFANLVNPILLLITHYNMKDTDGSGKFALDDGASIGILVTVNFGLPFVCIVGGVYFWCKKRNELGRIVADLEGGMDMMRLEMTTRAIKKNDRALEQHTTRTIAGVFMVMGFASFTAFTLVFVSYIFKAAQGDVVQATPFDLGRTYRDVQRRPTCEIGGALADIEFVYTGNWAAFSSTCCCRDHDFDPSVLTLAGGAAAQANASWMFGQLELWTCPDLSPANATSESKVLHKLRQREVRDPMTGAVLASGLHLRPFCSPFFASGVELPTYDETLLAFAVKYSNGTLAATELW